MRIEQACWTDGSGWVSEAPRALRESAQLVVVFGSRGMLRAGEGLAAIRAAWPGARCVGCSTAGEFAGTQVSDDRLVATAISLEHSRIACSHVAVGGDVDALTAGARLARDLPSEGLAHVFVLSDGTKVNGSDLVRGMTRELGGRVTVSGGLAGDGERFEETLVLVDGEPVHGAVTAVGFYGDRLRIGCGSMGGWDPFGPERLITRSRGNALYEFDGRSALQLYKTYLGTHAAGLPATGLLFPLSVRAAAGTGRGVVRTILAVDEAEQSLIFAGDVPEGAYARLMKANMDRLIDGATGAARAALAGSHDSAPELALLVSCVGRRMVLRQRVEEEAEAVRDVVGARAVLAGFYSYGEIAPFGAEAACELHNQTMTVTVLSEV
jgi:hypothetical protein